MKHTIPLAPTAHITLRAHSPAPARVEVEYQPAARRALRAALCLLTCWGLVPVLAFVPPHYPWVLGALAAGAYLGHKYWTGRYIVLAFSGSCPRCGRPLELSAGARIDLPHTLACFGCHHEPVLEIATPAGAPEHEVVLTHRGPECTGSWRLDPAALRPFLLCGGCGARHPATLEAQRIADRENEIGRILVNLTREGGSLL